MNTKNQRTAGAAMIPAIAPATTPTVMARAKEDAMSLFSPTLEAGDYRATCDDNLTPAR
jgi:hypothetical protein